MGDLIYEGAVCGPGKVRDRKNRYKVASDGDQYQRRFYAVMNSYQHSPDSHENTWYSSSVNASPHLASIETFFSKINIYVLTYLIVTVTAFGNRFIF